MNPHVEEGAETGLKGSSKGAWPCLTAPPGTHCSASRSAVGLEVRRQLPFPVLPQPLSGEMLSSWPLTVGVVVKGNLSADAAQLTIWSISELVSLNKEGRGVEFKSWPSLQDVYADSGRPPPSELQHSHWQRGR
jgi:hypothetical protein